MVSTEIISVAVVTTGPGPDLDPIIAAETAKGNVKGTLMTTEETGEIEGIPETGVAKAEVPLRGS